MRTEKGLEGKKKKGSENKNKRKEKKRKEKKRKENDNTIKPQKLNKFQQFRIRRMRRITNINIILPLFQKNGKRRRNNPHHFSWFVGMGRGSGEFSVEVFDFIWCNCWFWEDSTEEKEGGRSYCELVEIITKTKRNKQITFGKNNNKQQMTLLEEKSKVVQHLPFQ